MYFYDSSSLHCFTLFMLLGAVSVIWPPKALQYSIINSLEPIPEKHRA